MNIFISLFIFLIIYAITKNPIVAALIFLIIIVANKNSDSGDIGKWLDVKEAKKALSGIAKIPVAKVANEEEPFPSDAPPRNKEDLSTGYYDFSKVPDYQGKCYTKQYNDDWNSNPRYTSCYVGTKAQPDCDPPCKTPADCYLPSNNKLSGCFHPHNSLQPCSICRYGCSNKTEVPGVTNYGEIRDIDSRNATMTRDRARDNKAIEGWAVKSANYFKKNYSDELSTMEAKRWWGESEY